MTDGEEKKEEAKEIKKEERPSFLKEARELADRNEKAVEEMKKLVLKNEEIAAQNILGGKTDAGEQPQEKKEETDIEYANKVLSGEI